MPLEILSRSSVSPLNSSTSDSLVGNVGDWLTTTIQFKAWIGLTTIDGHTIQIFPNNTWELIGGDWSDEGFEVGDAITGSLDIEDATNIQAGFAPLAVAVNVTAVNGSLMTVDADIIPGIGSNVFVPGQDSVFIYNFLELTVDKTFTGIDFKYNQILNSDINAPSLNSILDATQTVFRGGGLDATSATWVDVTGLDPQSGNSVYSCRVQGVSKVSGVSTFNLEIVHNISGIYDSTNDIVNSTKPDWYNGQDCLTDIYKVKLYQTFADENITTESDLNSTIVKKLGNTGWFNENKNGMPSNYSLSNVAYEDSAADSILGILEDGTTKISFTVTDANSAFTATSDFNFGLAFIPLDRFALNNNALINLADLTANTLGVAQTYSSTGSPVVSTVDGFENLGGAKLDITSYHFEVISGSQLDVEIIVSPDSFSDYLDTTNAADRQMAFWVSVGDENSLTTTDRVNLMQPVDVVDVVEAIQEYPMEEVDSYPYDLDFYTAPTVAFNISELPLVTEDDVHVNYQFIMPDGYVMSSVTFGIDVGDSNDERVTVLDSFTENLINQPIDSNGTQQINVISSRQFLYDTDFKANKISLVRDSSIDSGTDRGYNFTVPYRNRWEWWKQNAAIPTSFYDSAFPQDNLNFEWFNKQDVSLRHFIELTYTDLNGDLINTRNYYDYNLINYLDDKDFTLSTKVYPDDTYAGAPTVGTITTPYSATQYAIIEGQDNFIRSIISKTATDLSDYKYGEITIEVYDGAGWLSMYKIRTDETPEAANPLQPVDGETTLKAYAVGNDLYLDCKLVPGLLPANLEYKITAEFISYRLSGEVQPIYSERDIIFGKIIPISEEDPTESRTNGLCDYTIPVLATNESTDLYKNDILGLLHKRAVDSFDIEMWLVAEDGTEYALNDNTYGTYFPFGSFTYEPNVWAYQVDWRMVLDELGEGCYSFRRLNTEFGLEFEFFSCCYELKEWSVENAENTVRVESVMNGYIEDLDLNYKGLNWGSHLRFEGSFGYQQHKYDQTVIIDTNNIQELNRQDLTSEFTLKSKIVPHKCITKPLYNWFLRATETFISDYNSDNHSHEYKSFPVILKDNETTKYLERNRGAVISVKFAERVLKRRVSTAIGDRPQDYLSPDYVYADQCPSGGSNDVFIKGIFNIGDADMGQLIIDADNAGTFTLLTDDGSSGTITLKKNGITVLDPSVSSLVLAVSDTLDATRTITSAVGYYKTTGTF